MSDGNYNRNLLPYRNYQSGVRAGEARMRSIALKAFEAFLEVRYSDTPEEERARMLAEFKNELL